MLVFVKLGGSLITDKRVENSFRADAAARVAAEIQSALTRNPDLRLLIGHGSGSFGHVAAKRYGTMAGVHTPEQWRGFAHVATVAAELNYLMAKTLDAAGVPGLANAAVGVGAQPRRRNRANGARTDPAGTRTWPRAAGLRRCVAGRGARRDDYLDRNDLLLSGAALARQPSAAARRSRWRLRSGRDRSSRKSRRRRCPPSKRRSAARRERMSLAGWRPKSAIWWRWSKRCRT